MGGDRLRQAGCSRATPASASRSTNFSDVLSDPLYREIAWTTFQIATAAMVVQLLVAVPLAYVIAFKAGRWELPLLLFLVLADELNPMVRIYAWRMLLGREGLINEGADEHRADRRSRSTPCCSTSSRSRSCSRRAT